MNTIYPKLSQPIDLQEWGCYQLQGVGPRTQMLLNKLHIHTVFDLLLHLPASYENRTRLTPLAALKPKMRALVEGEIAHKTWQGGRKKSLVLHLKEGSGYLKVRFFHANPLQMQQFENFQGRMRCFGEVRFGKGGYEMVHPDYQLLTKHASPLPEHLTPVYPMTEGLKQGILRRLMNQGLQLLDRYPLKEFLNSSLRDHWKLMEINQAIRLLHHPSLQEETKISLARRRLAFEELLAYQLQLRKTRNFSQKTSSYDFQKGIQHLSKMMEQLPFELTSAQKRVLNEMMRDLQSGKAMWRLLQGDVGSGKTVVGAIIAFLAIESGFQAAFMAPTEILANQHAKNLSQWLSPLGIQVVLLTGKLSAKNRREVLEQTAQGVAHLVVGTHAIFQGEVQFKNLALVIIDEQHRFGVHQRLNLRQKGEKEGLKPHQLIMTATPIPRTLAMTAYAELDCSTLDELPRGRKPIKTVLISQSRRKEVLVRLGSHVKTHHQQVYWVCPFIEESEELQCEAAIQTYETLVKELPFFRIGLMHGKLTSNEKDAVMQLFKAHDLDLLVATTVIEVGIDVPNATLMVIENPERMGLAQLHQLRGRVGRGNQPSFCILLYKPPLNQNAKKRLAILRETQDGFVISEKDLELRGPGNLLGTQQAGILRYKVADLMQDGILLPPVQRLAEELVLKDGVSIHEPLVQRWLKKAGFYADA